MKGKMMKALAQWVTNTAKKPDLTHGERVTMEAVAEMVLGYEFPEEPADEVNVAQLLQKLECLAHETAWNLNCVSGFADGARSMDEIRTKLAWAWERTREVERRIREAYDEVTKKRER